MYHSITFGSKNSYSDWHLVPDGRQIVVMPEPKTSIVDIPGANGSLDLSESLTNYPIYNNREGSFSFHVLNDIEPLDTLYSKIATYLHGRIYNVVLEDDPDYFYKGRHKIAWSPGNDGTWSHLEISYTYDPFKYYKYSSLQEAPEKYSYVSNTGTNTLTLTGDPTLGRVPIIPRLTISNVSGTFKLTLNNSELGISNLVKEFSTGTSNVYHDFILSNISGNNPLTIKMEGTGKLTIEFRRASL